MSDDEDIRPHQLRQMVGLRLVGARLGGVRLIGVRHGVSCVRPSVPGIIWIASSEEDMSVKWLRLVG